MHCMQSYLFQLNHGIKVFLTLPYFIHSCPISSIVFWYAWSSIQYSLVMIMRFNKINILVKLKIYYHDMYNVSLSCFNDVIWFLQFCSPQMPFFPMPFIVVHRFSFQWWIFRIGKMFCAQFIIDGNTSLCISLVEYSVVRIDSSDWISNDSTSSHLITVPMNQLKLCLIMQMFENGSNTIIHLFYWRTVHNPIDNIQNYIWNKCNSEGLEMKAPFLNFRN